MDLLGDISDIAGTAIGGLGSISGGGGGGGGLLGSLVSPQNVLLAGLSALNYFGNKEQGNESRDIRNQELALLQDKFGFEKQQHSDAIREKGLDRKLAAGSLAGNLAGSQISASVEAGKARQQAAIAKMTAIQQAYQNLAGVLLNGGALSSNAIGSLTRSAQAPLIG